MIPLDGRMAFTRAWHGDHIKRGAQLHLTDGRRARVLSARDGVVFVRTWTDGKRIAVRPTDLVAAS